MTEYHDAFNNLLELGDEVATIPYNSNIPYRGIVVKFGKLQIKLRDNFHNPDINTAEKWVATYRSIKLRSKEQIELEQD